MLVLERKLDESIVIGDNIIVKVISVDKGVVKLGIEAPSSISIVRSELLEDIKGSNIAASKETSADALSSLAELLKK